jgi:hypothetical protein
MRALIRSSPQTSQPWLPCLCWLEHEPNSLRIGLALQAGEPTSFAAEADPPGFPDADPIGGLIGTTGQGLGGIGVKVVRNPGRIRLGRKGMQGVFRKAKLLAERRKGGFAGLFVGTRDETGLLPSALGTHPTQAFHGLTQQRIVQVASGLKMPAQVLGLLAAHLERQFQQEGGRCFRVIAS